MKTLEFVIPGRLPGLNAMIKWGRWEYYRKKKEKTKKVAKCMYPINPQSNRSRAHMNLILFGGNLINGVTVIMFMLVLSLSMMPSRRQTL